MSRQSVVPESPMRLGPFIAVLLVMLAGCSPPDREAEVRAFIDEAVAAAESRSTGFFRSHIDDAYTDARGRDRDQLIDLIRGYFFVNPSVEIVSRIQSVMLEGEDFAIVVMQAAVVGNRGGGVLDIDADFYTVELELARDDDWKVIGASWDR